MAPTRIHADHVDPAPLGQPLNFTYSGKTAKNRFMKGAMSERLATWDANDPKARGVPTKELINVYRRWGEGGFGLILSGNTMIEYDQLEGAGNLIIPPDAPFEGERFEAFRAMAEAAKANGSLFFSQLSHPGRQVPEAVNPYPVSASDVQLEGVVLGSTYGKPRPMVEEDFKTVIGSFAHAAEYCHKAGFDGVELHGAHGYLLAQFLSLSTNKRTDKYGGSIINRSRIIMEIANAIRGRVNDPSFSIGIKVNSVEFQDGGLSAEECKDLCRVLEDNGFDYVELSGGTYQFLLFSHQRESTKKREAFFLEFAKMITPELTKTKTYITGGLRTAKAMVDALETVDGIGLGRPAADDFSLPARILGGEVQSAVQNLLDQQNFALTNIAAGSQIRLVGNDKQPLDMSREEHKAVFEKSAGKFIESMADNADNSKFGHVDISGAQLESYGTPYFE